MFNLSIIKHLNDDILWNLNITYLLLYKCNPMIFDVYFNNALRITRNNKIYYDKINDIITLISPNKINFTTNTVFKITCPKMLNTIFINTNYIDINIRSIIYWAIRNSHIKLLKTLLKINNKTRVVRLFSLFTHSCCNGYIDTVKLFLRLKKINVSQDDNSALEWALVRPNCAIVELIIQHPSFKLHRPIKKSDLYNYIIKHRNTTYYEEIINIFMKYNISI